MKETQPSIEAQPVGCVVVNSQTEKHSDRSAPPRQANQEPEGASEGVSLANGKPQRTLLMAMPVPAGSFGMRFLDMRFLDMRFLDMRFLGYAVPGFLETGSNDPRGEHLDKRMSNMSSMSGSAATTRRLESP